MIQGAAGAGELAQYTYGCFCLAIHGSDKDGCILDFGLSTANSRATQSNPSAILGDK